MSWGGGVTEVKEGRAAEGSKGVRAESRVCMCACWGGVGREALVKGIS